MSEQVLSVGFMAALLKPIEEKADREEINDHLDTLNLSILVNYEGTLVYSNYADKDAVHGGMNFLVPSNIDDFEKQLLKANLEITHEVLPYAASWYNGVDSEMATTTLAEFLVALNKEG